MASTKPLGVIGYDPFGPHLAGPPRRCLALATRLAAILPVVLWAEGEVPGPLPANLEVKTLDPDAICAAASGYAGLLLPAQAALRDRRWFAVSCPVIVDCFDPFPLETAAILQGASKPEVEFRTRLGAWASLHAVVHGDYWLVANDTQRAYLGGLLVASGRMTPSLSHADGSIAPRTLLVPFGFDPPPPLDDSTIRRYRAAWGLDPDDSYMLWTGGLWPWMDPLAVVTAFEAAVNDFPTAHLVFPGTKALSGIGQALAQELCTRAQGSPCRDRIHCVDWIPAADWPHVAGGARIHVQADRPGWEAWISNRTRLLESLAHLLPVATTNHDPLTRSLQANWLVRSAPTLAEALVSAWHAFPMPEGHPELLVDLEQERDRYRWDVCVEALLKAAREGFTASPDKGQLNPIKTWIEQYPIPPPPGPLQKLWDRTLGHR